MSKEDDFPDTLPLKRKDDDAIRRFRRRLSDEELDSVATEVENRIYLRAGKRAARALLGFATRYVGAGVAAVVAWEAAKFFGINPEHFVKAILG